MKTVFNRHVTDPYNAFHLLELNKLDGFVIDFQIGQRMVAELNLVKKVSHHREPYYKCRLVPGFLQTTSSIRARLAHAGLETDGQDPGRE
ncbi:MAG: hypothetical protein MI864_19480 [Pseudomonadales bacterium]|nr:hypothetical protein [Pseudomonadales bacterium]